MVELSIITPSYNHAGYLRRCLQSVDVVALGRADIEHIVVDDASTDNSFEVLHRLSQQHPHRKLLRHGTNRGLSATLNTALDHASGNWIGWLNSDDSYYAPGMTRALATLRTISPRVGLLYGDVKIINEDANEAGTLRLYRGATSCFRLGFNPLLVPSVLLRRRFLRNGFDESYRFLIDIDTYCAVLQVAKSRYLPYPIGEWRAHAAQQSLNPRETDAQEWMYLAQKYGYRFSSGPTRIGRAWQRLLKLAQFRY